MRVNVQGTSQRAGCTWGTVKAASARVVSTSTCAPRPAPTAAARCCAASSSSATSGVAVPSPSSSAEPPASRARCTSRLLQSDANSGESQCQGVSGGDFAHAAVSRRPPTGAGCFGRAESAQSGERFVRGGAQRDHHQRAAVLGRCGGGGGGGGGLATSASRRTCSQIHSLEGVNRVSVGVHTIQLG
jgi:hypothetical protein